MILALAVCMSVPVVWPVTTTTADPVMRETRTVNASGGLTTGLMVNKAAAYRAIRSRESGMPENEYRATERLIGLVEAWHSLLITIHDTHAVRLYVSLQKYLLT